MLERTLLKAEVVYNGLGTPRLNSGVVVQCVQDESKIIAIDTLERLNINFPDALIKDVGFAITPKPVNAHMHLDLSTMPFTKGSYKHFIEKVIEHDNAGKRNLAAAQEGLKQLKQQGISTLGDIVTEEEVMFELLQSDLQGVAYWEVFAPNAKDAESEFSELLEQLRRFKKLERQGGMRIGLSPHTPHTVSAPLLKKVVVLAKQNRLPLQIHVAESPAELPFYQSGEGALKDLYETSMTNWVAPQLSPVQYLKQLGILDAQPTLIHMVHVSEEDVRDVQKAGCVVVHCPRSNEALQCGRFPWEIYAKHGVTVAIGTDSSGSSPSLSIQEEVQAALKQHGDNVNAQGLIWAAVKGGYRALGMTPPRFVRGDPADQLFIWD